MFGRLRSGRSTQKSPPRSGSGKKFKGKSDPDKDRDVMNIQHDSRRKENWPPSNGPALGSLSSGVGIPGANSFLPDQVLYPIPQTAYAHTGQGLVSPVFMISSPPAPMVFAPASGMAPSHVPDPGQARTKTEAAPATSDKDILYHRLANHFNIVARRVYGPGRGRREDHRSKDQRGSEQSLKLGDTDPGIPYCFSCGVMRGERYLESHESEDDEMPKPSICTTCIEQAYIAHDQSVFDRANLVVPIGEYTDPMQHFCVGCGDLRSSMYHDHHPVSARREHVPSICAACSTQAHHKRNTRLYQDVCRFKIEGVLIRHFCWQCGTARSKTYQLSHRLRAGESPRCNFCDMCERNLSRRLSWARARWHSHDSNSSDDGSPRKERRSSFSSSSLSSISEKSTEEGQAASEKRRDRSYNDKRSVRFRSRSVDSSSGSSSFSEMEFSPSKKRHSIPIERDFSSTKRRFTSLERDYTAKARDITPTQRDCNPKDQDATPTQQDFTWEERDFAFEKRDFTVSGHDYEPPARHITSKEPDVRRAYVHGKIYSTQKRADALSAQDDETSPTEVRARTRERNLRDGIFRSKSTSSTHESASSAGTGRRWTASGGGVKSKTAFRFSSSMSYTPPTVETVLGSTAGPELGTAEDRASKGLASDVGRAARDLGGTDYEGTRQDKYRSTSNPAFPTTDRPIKTVAHQSSEETLRAIPRKGRGITDKSQSGRRAWAKSPTFRVPSSSSVRQVRFTNPEVSATAEPSVAACSTLSNSSQHYSPLRDYQHRERDASASKTPRTPTVPRNFFASPDIVFNDDDEITTPRGSSFGNGATAGDKGGFPYGCTLLFDDVPIGKKYSTPAAGDLSDGVPPPLSEEEIARMYVQRAAELGLDEMSGFEEFGFTNGTAEDEEQPILNDEIKFPFQPMSENGANAWGVGNASTVQPTPSATTTPATSSREFGTDEQAGSKMEWSYLAAPQHAFDGGRDGNGAQLPGHPEIANAYSAGYADGLNARDTASDHGCGWGGSTGASCMPAWDDSFKSNDIPFSYAYAETCGDFPNYMNSTNGSNEPGRWNDDTMDWAETKFPFRPVSPFTVETLHSDDEYVVHSTTAKVEELDGNSMRTEDVPMGRYISPSDVANDIQSNGGWSRRGPISSVASTESIVNNKKSKKCLEYLAEERGGPSMSMVSKTSKTSLSALGTAGSKVTEENLSTLEKRAEKRPDRLARAGLLASHRLLGNGSEANETSESSDGTYATCNEGTVIYCGGSEGSVIYCSATAV